MSLIYYVLMEEEIMKKNKVNKVQELRQKPSKYCWTEVMKTWFSRK